MFAMWTAGLLSRTHTRYSKVSLMHDKSITQRIDPLYSVLTKHKCWNANHLLQLTFYAMPRPPLNGHTVADGKSYCQSYIQSHLPPCMATITVSVSTVHEVHSSKCSEWSGWDGICLGYTFFSQPQYKQACSSQTVSSSGPTEKTKGSKWEQVLTKLDSLYWMGTVLCSIMMMQQAYWGA